MPTITRVALAVAFATALPVAAQETAGTPVRKRTPYEDLQLFGQVFNQLRVNHPDSIDTHRLLMAAVTGMVQAADPHSYVIPGFRLDPTREEAIRNGKLVPVPIAFTYVGGAPVVVSVAPGTRATQLDILPGDELLSVDGAPVAAESPFELEMTLAGPKKTDVTLLFERRRADGSLTQITRQVRRERAEGASAVPAALMLSETTGYIRITTFADDKVAEDLHNALGRLEKAGMNQLVLDLRGNGGGVVREASRIAAEFLPAGAVVYASSGRRPEIEHTEKVSRAMWKTERRYPIVIMIDEGTASAAELVAGALQDHDRALIAGRASFGKALLMQGMPLSDGSVIMLVIGHVKTPCGRIIQRQYREVTRRDYYRMALAERDTAGRPTCKTDGGRVVYGGGGIRPDVPLATPSEAPSWVTRAGELQLPLAWVGGWLELHGASLGTREAYAATPVLPATALSDFRAFAKRQGLEIPADADTDARLQRLLSDMVAWAKWGDEGLYALRARTDAQVTAAATLFPQARALPGVRP